MAYFDGGVRVVQSRIEDEEGCYGDESNHGNQQAGKQPFVRFFTVHGDNTL